MLNVALAEMCVFAVAISVDRFAPPVVNCASSCSADERDAAGIDAEIVALVEMSANATV